MRPRTDRVVVERESGERTLPWGLFLPGQDLGLAFMGRITHAGPGRVALGRNLPMDVKIGDRIAYSTRVDQYELEDGTQLDVVEEASVIGIFV